METEIDLNEWEHFLKANLHRPDIDLNQKQSECELKSTQTSLRLI